MELRLNYHHVTLSSRILHNKHVFGVGSCMKFNCILNLPPYHSVLETTIMLFAFPIFVWNLTVSYIFVKTYWLTNENPPGRVSVPSQLPFPRAMPPRLLGPSGGKRLLISILRHLNDSESQNIFEEKSHFYLDEEFCGDLLCQLQFWQVLSPGLR